MDASSVNSAPDLAREQIAQLTAEVRDLARRVSLLEEASRVAPAHEAPPLPRIEVPSDLAPAIGKALVAIAGAYLLRALTEFRVLPPIAGVSAGILYTAAWLEVAIRTRSRTAARLYASASMLILAPLLWEACSALHAIPSWTAAAVVALFAIASARSGVAPIISAACAAMAAVFLIGLRDLAAFSFAILAIAACAEFMRSGSRWAVALLADFSIAVFSFVMLRGVPGGYEPAWTPAAGIAQLSLIAIYCAGLFTRRRVFSVFEIFQAGCASVIGIAGLLHFTRSPAPFAWCLIAASAACYGFALLARAPQRNGRTLAAFAVALMLGGTYLAISGTALAAIWSILGVLLAFTRVTAFHSGLYLWSAALISHAAMAAKLRVWDDAAAPFKIESMLLLIAGFAAYFVLARADRPWPALAAAATGTLFAASSASGFASGTWVVTLLALALTWAGANFARRELVWLGYALMAVAAARIVTHDFARGAITLVMSLAGYGVALILLPRILRRNS